MDSNFFDIVQATDSKIGKADTLACGYALCVERKVVEMDDSRSHAVGVMKVGRIVSSIVSSALGASILMALTFAVAPQLHKRVHRDATTTQHECAVTLVASGKYEHSDVPPLVTVPQPAAQFSRIPALNPIWVAAPFLGASVFEHAPPALS